MKQFQPESKLRRKKLGRNLRGQLSGACLFPESRFEEFCVTFIYLLLVSSFRGDNLELLMDTTFCVPTLILEKVAPR